MEETACEVICGDPTTPAVTGQVKVKEEPCDFRPVSRCGLAIRRLAGKQKDLGSIRFDPPFSSLQKKL